MFLTAITCLDSCNKTDPEPELKEPHISQHMYRGIHVGDLTTIKGDNLNGLEWISAPFFVAEVDASQRIVPKHVGLSFIYGGIGDDFKEENRIVVEVSPKYTDFDLPFICNQETYEGIPYDGIAMFGYVGPSHIKEYEKRNLDPRSNSSMLIYNTGNTKSPYVVYSFSSTSSALSVCGSLIDPAYINNLPEFLNERYEVISVDLSKPAAYFIHKTHSKESEIIDYTGGLEYFSQLGGILLAFTHSNGTRSSSLENCMNELANQLKETLSKTNTK